MSIDEQIAWMSGQRKFQKLRLAKWVREGRMSQVTADYEAAASLATFETLTQLRGMLNRTSA
ncbi:MAG: hypothetical protein ACRYF5_16675 [Janthinobacterium lividum]